MRQKWLTVVVCFLAVSIAGPGVRAADITVSDVYARITPTGSGGAFMVIHNHGSDADRLLAISTDVARKTELHETRMDEGVMRMRPVEALEVAPGGTVALEPGGPHVMLFGISKIPKPGDVIELELSFEKAGDVMVAAEVRTPGAAHQDMSHSRGKGHQPVAVTINLISPGGIGPAIGEITMAPMADGVLLTPSLSDLSPEPHALHVHENPDCGPGMEDGQMVAGFKAGDHFDPGGGGHGHSHGEHGHQPAGDLPELLVDDDGTATQAIEVKTLTVSQIIGRSIMIHAHGETPNDETKSKGGGARVACGVVGG